MCGAALLIPVLLVWLVMLADVASGGGGALGRVMHAAHALTSRSGVW